MSAFDDYIKKASTPKKVEAISLTRSDPFELDRRRSALLDEERAKMRNVLDNAGLPESVREMVTLNLSTSSAIKERKVPTHRDKVQALWDYWKFLEIINFHGGPLSFSACHRELVAWKLRRGATLRQLVLEARGMLKSTLLCVGYTLWRVYQNPNIRIFVGTEGLKLSKAFIREVEDYLVDDFNVAHVWNARPHFTGPLIPAMDSLGKQRRLIKDIADEFGEKLPGGSDRKKVWRAEAIQCIRTRALKEPTITAGSVGQQSTGFHFDEIIFDDIHNYENTSSTTKLEKVFAFINDIESVLDPPSLDMELAEHLQSALGADFDKASRWCVSGGRQTVLGTRWDEADYYNFIANNEGLGYEHWEKNIYANGVNSDDGYRWPEKWNKQLEQQTRARLEKLYGSRGTQLFYSQYMNKIVDADNAVLAFTNVQYVHPDNYKFDVETGWVDVYDHSHVLLGSFKPELFIDPTSTANKTSDFCAMAVGGKLSNGYVYVCDWWMKREPITVWLDKMWELINKWGLHSVHVEMVGGFKVLEYTINQQWLNDRAKRPIAVKSYSPPTGAGAASKIQRIESVLSPLIFNSMLHLPLAASRDTELKKQLMFFGKETVHDDGPDVLTALAEGTVHRVKQTNHNFSNPDNLVIGQFGGMSYASTGTYGGVDY